MAMNAEARLAVVEAENDALREQLRQVFELLRGTWRAPIELGLTGSEEAILATLVQREFASKDALMQGLYSTLPGDQPEIKIVDVFVCKLRRKLAPFGVQIQTMWGRGYGLNAENRERLKAIGASASAAV